MDTEDALRRAHAERMRPRFHLPVTDDQPMSNLFSESDIRAWEDDIERVRQAMLALASEVHRLRGEPVPTWTLEDFWQEGLYLSLLRPWSGRERSRLAVAALRECLHDTTREDRFALIASYLGHGHNNEYQGWRPVLVACAIALMYREDGHAPMFWTRLSARTWAAPQVAATLSVIDPTFRTTAAALLDGQGSVHTLDGKGARSLLALMTDHPTYARWASAYQDESMELHFVADLVPTWRDTMLSWCLPPE